MREKVAGGHRGERAGSLDIIRPHHCLPCPSGGSSGDGNAAPGLWSPVQAEHCQCQAGSCGLPLPPAARPGLTQSSRVSACIRRGPSVRPGSIVFTASCRISSSCSPGDTEGQAEPHLCQQQARTHSVLPSSVLPSGCLFTSPAKHLAAVVAVKGQLQEQLSASSSRSSRSC